MTDSNRRRYLRRTDQTYVGIRAHNIIVVTQHTPMLEVISGERKHCTVIQLCNTTNEY
jgi:hypothetical protein